METVGSAPADNELQLLTDWSDPAGRGRRGRSAVISLVLHALAFVVLRSVPDSIMQPPPRQAPPRRVVTALIRPPVLTLTQREPNVSKTVREFRSPDLTPRINPQANAAPDPQRPAPRRTTPTPPPPPTQASPQVALPEPPVVQIAVNENPKLTLPVQTPQVQAPPPESPFEDVAAHRRGTPDPRIAEAIGPSVNNAIRGALKGGAPNIPGVGQISSTGADLPQLLSDPQGVDFRPYLARVLSSVKQYWETIMPAVVKQGRRGNVSLQFAISRNGTVRTVAFVHQTGDQQLDNAAVAAISGGGPFAPLPGAYRGNEIHVQMNFTYNAPRRP